MSTFAHSSSRSAHSALLYLMLYLRDNYRHYLKMFTYYRACDMSSTHQSQSTHKFSGDTIQILQIIITIQLSHDLFNIINIETAWLSIPNLYGNKQRYL